MSSTPWPIDTFQNMLVHLRTMVDNLKPSDRLKTMRAVKAKGTKPERLLFSMLAGMRIKGWLRNADEILGKPDVVFADQQVAIFVDGCFWHGCPHCRRKLPQTNREYWKNKIKRNVKRAKTQNQELVEDGWSVFRIWEHEISDPEKRQQLKNRLRKVLARKSSNGSNSS